MTKITRSEIIKVARSYLGVKFRMYGRDRTGVDCVGLLYCIGNELGVNVGDYKDYTRGPEPEKLQAALEAYTYPAPMNPPLNGQVLKLRQMIFPMHLGILVVENGQRTVINANIKKKQVVEESFDNWRNLILEHRDIKGVYGP